MRMLSIGRVDNRNSADSRSLRSASSGKATLALRRRAAGSDRQALHSAGSVRAAITDSRPETVQLAKRRGAARRAESSLEHRRPGQPLNDFADTAAVMVNLNLVVSADHTSPVHLAGALRTALPLRVAGAGYRHAMTARGIGQCACSGNDKLGVG